MMVFRLWRSTFGIVALVAVMFSGATLAIGVIAYEVTHEAFEQQLDHRIRVESATLVGERQDRGPAALAATVRQRAAAREDGSLDYALLDASGRPVAGSMTVLSPVRLGYEELLRFRRGAYEGVGQAWVTSLPEGALIVVADRRTLDEIDTTLGGLFSIAFALMLLLGVGAAAFVGWMTARRLARVSATAKAIIDGDLARRVPTDGSGSEFDRLATTLNLMLDRIGVLMDNLRQVSTDVAHDLRTPLTRLHAQLDRAAGGDPDAITAARDQAGELLEIFAALLRIAEIEGLAERLRPTPVDLTILLNEMVETYRPDIEEEGRRMVATIEPGLALIGDRRLIAQAISNLIENGLRHSPAGATITVTGEQRAGRILMTVGDNGPGVTAADSARLFQRFARAEVSRTTPGHGLGLALVRAVATAHNGHAKLLSEPGFVVRLSLPR
jgi:signal transduction histidine kinase